LTEVTIGIVGARPFVDRVLALGRSENSGPHRLLPSAYEQETDAPAATAQIASKVDVLLFAGPLPFELAAAANAVRTPATFVPLSGWALPTAVLKSALVLGVDPELLTIDSASQHDVEEVFDAVGLRSSGVRVLDYARELDSKQFLRFHVDGHATGSSGAITSIPSVAAELRRLELPHVLMTPSRHAIAHALDTARLLGAGSTAEESRLALAVVRLPSSTSATHTALTAYERQSMRVAVHGALLEAARESGSVVVPRDEVSFFLFLTLGSLKRLTGNLTYGPFATTVRDATGLMVEVGIGFANTVADAEANALTAVAHSAQTRGSAAALVWPTGEVALLPASASSGTGNMPQDSDPEDITKALLRGMIAALKAANDDRRIVDAQQVSELMSIPLRSARRALRSLVEAGYAWPLPPDPADRPGRPPVPYQLLEEKLQ
jgi:hypothetical protein